MAPGRRRELAAAALSALRRSAVRRLADQGAVAHPEALSVQRLRREAVSFRRQAACPGAGLRRVSLSGHLYRVAVRRPAAEAPSVLRRQVASSKAFRPEAQPSEVLLPVAPRLAALSWWTVLPWELRPVSPAPAWCQPEAAPCVAARPAVASLCCLRREAAAGAVLLPAALLAWCALAVPNSGEAAAVGSDAGAAQPWAEPVVSAQPPAVARQEVSAAAAELQQEAVGVSGAAAGLQREAAAAVRDAAEGPLRAAEPVGVSDAEAAPQPVAAWVLSASQPAARPSAAPSVFHQARALPWPAPRRAARSAHAMRMSQAASPSERSWQAARCEGLS